MDSLELTQWQAFHRYETEEHQRQQQRKPGTHPGLTGGM